MISRYDCKEMTLPINGCYFTARGSVFFEAKLSIIFFICVAKIHEFDIIGLKGMQTSLNLNPVQWLCYDEPSVGRCVGSLVCR